MEPQEQERSAETKPRSLRSLGRYEGLDQHELIYLLDEVDDERARARFREAIYISIIVWMIIGGLSLYGPRYIWKSPHLIVAPDEPRKDHLTYLDLPPDLAKKLQQARPTPNVAERNQQSQSPKPSPQAAMPRQGTPGPTAPQPKPAPQQQAPQQQQPQQQAQNQPQQQPQRQQPVQKPQQTPLVDSPTPSATRPNFNTGGGAGQAVQNAARDALRGGGGGDYGNGPSQQGGANVGTKILSDTQGVDFSRYLQRLLSDVKKNWLPLIPEECHPPLNKKGITGVRFTIQPDGKISAMHLDYSTHDVAIDRAAWGSITGMGQAQPLPREFHGPNLELRIEFQINQDPR